MRGWGWGRRGVVSSGVKEAVEGREWWREYLEGNKRAGYWMKDGV